MLTQTEKLASQSRAQNCVAFLKKEHALFASLTFLTLFFLFLSISAQNVRANPLVSSNTPGIIMAKLEFEINSPIEDKLLSPKQMRVELLNSRGNELIHIKSPMNNFDPKAGFPYSKKDTYKRPDDYPKSREAFIAEQPKSYKAALARYVRALYLLKASTNYRSKERARAYALYCHKHATELYKKEMAALKRLP